VISVALVPLGGIVYMALGPIGISRACSDLKGLLARVDLAEVAQRRMGDGRGPWKG